MGLTGAFSDEHLRALEGQWVRLQVGAFFLDGNPNNRGRSRRLVGNPPPTGRSSARPRYIHHGPYQHGRRAPKTGVVRCRSQNASGNGHSRFRGQGKSLCSPVQHQWRAGAARVCHPCSALQAIHDKARV